MTDRAGAEMVERIAEWDLDHVFVEFPDIDGTSRSKQLDADYFRESWEEGFSMNMLLLAVSSRTDVPEGSGYGEELNFADGLVHPIPETFRRLPWRDDAARVLCDFEYEGGPAGAYTRHVLERVLAEVPDGVEFQVGSELEFYLLDEVEDGYEPATTDRHECVSWATEEISGFYDRAARWAKEYGIPVSSIQHEYGAGQFEILFEYGDPLAQADRTFDFKRLVKQTARETGHTATFMAQPFTGGAGNGYHLHLSAWADGENYFARGNGSGSHEGELSDEARGFVGGLLEHAPALVALGCPTLNALKRFEPGSFSPYTNSWGYNNRTAAVRVPANGPVRLENRVSAADANPYLVIAATLAAGLDGMRRELDPGSPVDGDAAGQRPPLPRSPELVLRALEDDEVLVDALGEEFVRAFTAVKRAELDSFYGHVTDWEERYIEVL